MTSTSGKLYESGLTDGLAETPPVVERQQSSTEASPRQAANSTRLRLEFRGPEASRTSLRHAAFVARADVHLLPCELFDVKLFDVKLKRRQPGKLDGQQRVGDA